VLVSLGPADVSHDGKRLAFFRWNKDRTELVTASRESSDVRVIAALPLGASYSNPRWSRDDQRIAFQQDLVGASFTQLLMIASLSGEVGRVPADFQFHGFTWDLNGSALIASTSEGSTMSYPNTFNLWRLPINGGERSQFTFGEVSYEFPDMDTHGNLVASRVKAQANVWKFPVTGTTVENAQHGTRITNQTGQVQTLTTSPDETQVAFLSDYGGHANVWTAQVADGTLRAVTHEFDPRVVVAVPYWSPRGDLINFLSNRNTGGEVTLWVTKPDGSDARDLGVKGVWACWSPDGRWLYYSNFENGVYFIRKVPVEGGAPVTVRDDNAVASGFAPNGSGLYFFKITGSWDFEIRYAPDESGPSLLISRLAGSLIPSGKGDTQPYLSPDGKWMATPLIDGATTNLWGLSTIDHKWKRFTDFGSRSVMITRRIGWSRDSKSIYASVSDIDSDIVRLVGLR
jgi:Tol biopolymer transport system component